MWLKVFNFTFPPVVTFGPQLVNLLVDNNEATKFLAEKFGIPARLIRSKEQMNETIAQMTQAIQQQQQMQQQMAQQGNEGQETPTS